MIFRDLCCIEADDGSDGVWVELFDDFIANTANTTCYQHGLLRMDHPSILNKTVGTLSIQDQTETLFTCVSHDMSTSKAPWQCCHKVCQ